MTAEERERGERLRAFCAAVQGEPAVWGSSDCSTWPAQWVANETGREFDWPAYSSREEADAIIEREGGLVNVWERVAAQAGLIECDPDEVPPLGSVGIIETSHHGGQVGCIFAHGGIGCMRATVGHRAWGMRPYTIRQGGVIFRIIVKVWRLP